MENPIADNCLFCAGKGGNEGLLFKKESQRKVNCCPSRREPNANKVEQIEADQSRKRRRGTNSAKQGKKSKGLTAWRIPQDL